MKKEFYDNLEGKVYLLLVFEFTFVISTTYLVRTNQRFQMVHKTYKIIRLLSTSLQQQITNLSNFPETKSSQTLIKYRNSHN